MGVSSGKDRVTSRFYGATVMRDAYMQELEELTEEYLKLNQQSLTRASVVNVYRTFEDLESWYDSQEKYDQRPS